VLRPVGGRPGGLHPPGTAVGGSALVAGTLAVGRGVTRGIGPRAARACLAVRRWTAWAHRPMRSARSLVRTAGALQVLPATDPPRRWPRRSLPPLPGVRPSRLVGRGGRIGTRAGPIRARAGPIRARTGPIRARAAAVSRRAIAVAACGSRSTAAVVGRAPRTLVPVVGGPPATGVARWSPALVGAIPVRPRHHPTPR
jgi:hypothetical protein